jgi:bifunctional non-homologous end joining protein LigD
MTPSACFDQSHRQAPEQIEKADRELHLEGVVGKRGNSRYEPGKRRRAWVKVKFNRRQEFVVGGVNPL